MGASSDEFPLLAAHGLYAADIRGDGNCLFNALSDQLYGSQNEHHAIRRRVIQYMREHSEYYKQFIDVYPGGGIRRNPKRKNAGAYATPTHFTPPSPEEVDAVFESHLQSMAKGGTYGDNMEISAFSSAYDVDVKIYQRDFAYMVSGAGESGVRDRVVTHIAYHVWEHYSSIRNTNGPHTGPPKLSPKALSLEEEERSKAKLAETPYVLPWMVDVVSQSLPFLAEKVLIKRMLEDCRGSIDNAVSKLLDAEERGSVSSGIESSSVEREPDSDEEAINAPNKKQDRRLSRATRTALKEREEQRRRDIAAKFASHDSSQDSLALPLPSRPRPIRSPRTRKSDDEDPADGDWQPSPTRHENKPSLKPEESTTTAPVTRTRLKLNPPKPPGSLHNNNRSQQKQPGPQARFLSARDRKDMKKQAQKAAAKERKQASALVTAANGNIKSLPILTKEKALSQGIESGIKTLYI